MLFSDFKHGSALMSLVWGTLLLKLVNIVCAGHRVTLMAKFKTLPFQRETLVLVLLCEYCQKTLAGVVCWLAAGLLAHFSTNELTDALYCFR